MRQIAAILTDEGVPTKRGAPQWSKTTVGRILNGQGALRVAAVRQPGQPLDRPQPATKAQEPHYRQPGRAPGHDPDL